VSKPQTLSPGQILGTNYRIERKIGEGGFGDVYLATQILLDREVAIKAMRQQDNPFLPDLFQRFEREVNLARKLEHPNIVRLYDHGRLPNGLIFMALEYIRGQELEEVLREEGRLPLDRVTHIIMQILDALAEAHSLGIEHRDLKPSNVMLTRAGLRTDVVKVLDFGIAKAFDGTYADLTAQNLMQGVGFGTPQYMAPEQIIGENAGPHTDIYAVGLIYVELATGVAPMACAEPTDVIQRQLKEEVPIPQWLRDCPLGPVLERALAKDWKQRYGSAEQMYKDIESRLTSSKRKSLDSYGPPPDEPFVGQAPVKGSSEIDSTPTMMTGGNPATVSGQTQKTSIESGPSVIVVNEGAPAKISFQPTQAFNQGRPSQQVPVAETTQAVRPAANVPTIITATSLDGQVRVLGAGAPMSPRVPFQPTVTVAPIPMAVVFLGVISLALFIALVLVLALI